MPGTDAPVIVQRILPVAGSGIDAWLEVAAAPLVGPSCRSTRGSAAPSGS
jgi:hypothetical protein